MEHHTLGCVIFDLDGTLLDSMNVWSQIDRNLLNHYGKTAPDDLTEQVKKMTIQQSAQYFIDRFQLPCQPEEFIALVQSMAADAYRNTLQLKSGVFPLLDWLDARNVPYCVATATYPDLAEAALKRLQVWERIAFLMTEQEIGVGKANDLPAGCQSDGLWQTANGCCRRCCTRHRNRCDRWIFHGWRL